MPQPPDLRQRRERAEWLGGVPTFVLLGLLVLIVFVFALASETFAHERTLVTVLRSSAWIAVIAVTTTVALAAGAVDFSIMSTAALSGIVAAAASAAWTPFVGIPVALAAGALVGLLNALFVVRFKVNAFLATLVMAGAIRGVDFALGQGTRGVRVQDWFMADVLPEEVGLIPIAFVLSVVVMVVATVVMDRTRAGRELLAVGGNPTAARLAGIPSAHLLTVAYVVSGIGAALGGVLLAARLGAGIPASGTGQELTLFSAILIAGTPLWGGRANIVGSVVAIILLTTLYTGLVLAGFPDRIQQIASGILLLFSIWLVARRSEGARLIPLRLSRARPVPGGP
jgi:ribose transport system permease protein